MLVAHVDTACDTDFDMYCSLYHIFDLENSWLTIFTEIFDTAWDVDLIILAYDIDFFFILLTIINPFPSAVDFSSWITWSFAETEVDYIEVFRILVPILVKKGYHTRCVIRVCDTCFSLAYIRHSKSDKYILNIWQIKLSQSHSLNVSLTTTFFLWTTFWTDNFFPLVFSVRAVTRRVPLVEYELRTLPGYILNSLYILIQYMDLITSIILS